MGHSKNCLNLTFKVSLCFRKMDFYIITLVFEQISTPSKPLFSKLHNWVHTKIRALRTRMLLIHVVGRYLANSVSMNKLHSESTCRFLVLLHFFYHTEPFSMGGQFLKIQVGSLNAQKHFGTRHTKKSFLSEKKLSNICPATKNESVWSTTKY